MSVGRRRWVLLAALASTAVGALCAVSWVVWTYERHTLEQQAFGALERQLELANWQIDAAIAPLLAAETARPAEHYRALYPTDEALAPAGGPVSGGLVLVPSPLLVRRDRYSILHFQWTAADGWSSPQLPPDEHRGVVLERGWTDEATLVADTRRLRSLADDDLGPFLRDRLQAPRDDATPGPIAALVPPGSDGDGQPRLLLARRSGDAVQGLWFDWPALRQRLRNAIDLGPDQLSLELARSPLGTAEPGTARLANLPVILRLTEPPPPPPGWSSTRRVLLLAWIGFLTTLGATVVALWTAWELSARRGRFATAVTHELRTPLTTFCLYSQLLADGAVADEQARGEYHRTLVRESERLRRVVDNVLTHARIEGRRAGLARERVALRALLDDLLPTLESRALEGGLCFEATDPRALDASVAVETDAQAVEQILLNLVDNAVKYAGDGELPELRVDVTVDARAVRVRVTDGGPGIPRDIERRLFQPYARGERAVAARAPGVGLGLALARELARELGGDVRLVPTATGASFELRLPRAA